MVLASKAAALGKGAGGASTVLKGIGGLALGGGAAAAAISTKSGEELPSQQQPQLPSLAPPPPKR